MKLIRLAIELIESKSDSQTPKLDTNKKCPECSADTNATTWKAHKNWQIEQITAIHRLFMRSIRVSSIIITEGRFLCPFHWESVN